MQSIGDCSDYSHGRKVRDERDFSVNVFFQATDPVGYLVSYGKCKSEYI